MMADFTRGVRAAALLLPAILLLAGCGGRSTSEFTYSASGRTLTLTALSGEMLHVRYTPVNGAPAPVRAWAIPSFPEPTGSFTVVEHDSLIELRTDSLVVFVQRNDARLTISDRHGHVLSEDLPVFADSLGTQLRKRLRPGEHIFGLGEKTGSLDKMGRSYTMWNTDVLNSGRFDIDQDPLYQSMPFYISVRDGLASGFFLNNTYRSTFDVGDSNPGILGVDLAGGAMDYVFFGGPTMPQVVRDYTSLTGRAPMPSLWALGYHQCRWGYKSADEILSVARGLRKRHIPADAMWFDIDYMDRFRIFTWNDSTFPDPAGLTRELDSLGFKAVTIIDPGVAYAPDQGYSVYDQGVAGGHFVPKSDGKLFIGEVWPGKAVFPDFTRPATRDWWSGLVADWVKEYTIGGIWVDMNEPATWQPKSGFPLDTRWDGEGIPTDHRETHNVYGSLMSQATREGLLQARPDQRPFVLTRAGFSGVQRYAASWNGDVPGTWEHLKGTPAMLMGMGLSGNPFVGSDLGGFLGGDDPNLFVRWVEMGAWTPFFRNHAEKWAHAGEPWAYDDRVERIVTDVIRQRYRYLPYWYSLFHEQTRTGAPMMRPLVFDPDFTGDKTAWKASDEFLVGSHLLVAPVLQQDATARPVYLPAGTWTDIHSGARLIGPLVGLASAPLQKTPMYARENAILPTWPLMESTRDAEPDTLYLDLYPIAGSPEGSFTVYEDDGISLDPSYATTEITLSALANEVRYHQKQTRVDGFTPPESVIVLRFRGIETVPQAVDSGTGEHDLKPLQRCEAGQCQPDTWEYTQGSSMVVVILPNDGGERSVSIHVTAPR